MGCERACPYAALGKENALIQVWFRWSYRSKNSQEAPFIQVHAA